MKKFTVLLAMAGLAFSAIADNMDFSYNISNAELGYYGTAKKENYDIAILIDNPALKGAKVTGLSVPIPGDASLYSEPSGFMCTELKIERVDGLRVNAPDICSVTGEIKDGYLNVTFTEPYTLGDQPIYVGYAVKLVELTDVSKYPIAIVPGENPNGMWFHSSRSQLSWSNYVEKIENGMQSAMVVHLDGEFAGESAAVTLPQRTVCLSNQPNKYSFSIVNGGKNAINDIDYTFSIAGKEGSGKFTFPSPVKGALGAIGEVEIELPAIHAKAQYPLTLSITKVNGVENPNLAATDEAPVIFAPTIPVMRPLVEEYTGLWCGNCPRGYAALEYLKEEYKSDFVAAAWHNGDPMQVTRQYPSSVPGYPNAVINRSSRNIDPSALYTSWPKACAEDTDFSIGCYMEYADDSKTSIKATSYISSISDAENMKVGYLVVADGLQNKEWGQENYYSHMDGRNSLAAAEAYMPKDFAKLFFDADLKVFGLVYNDVVIDFENALGCADSLPVEITAFEEYTHEITFSLDNIVSSYDKTEIPIIKDQVRVIAFVLDEKGLVLNSCSSGYPGQIPDAVESVADGCGISSSMWFDPQGKRVAEPRGGIFVRVDTMNDGSVRTSKVIVK